ncbi:MAG: hypothetical protein CV088_15680 [Nitrospira sp. LK70]|nr:hypothetical protein [Nitrospira sp. LK70]
MPPLRLCVNVPPRPPPPPPTAPPGTRPWPPLGRITRLLGLQTLLFPYLQQAPDAATSTGSPQSRSHDQAWPRTNDGRRPHGPFAGPRLPPHR